MGLLAVQEDGEGVSGSDHRSTGGLGKNRGVRQAAARHSAGRRTAEGEAGTGNDRARIRGAAGEYPPGKMPREPGISESAGDEGGDCGGEVNPAFGLTEGGPSKLRLGENLGDRNQNYVKNQNQTKVRNPTLTPQNARRWEGGPGTGC